jgi:hypothetical protein
VTRTSATDPIVAFYSGAPDDRGRTVGEILAWDDERLESVHDYIQWLFPLRQPSGVNPGAPLVTDVTVRAFSTDPRLTALLHSAFERMLRFYGLSEGPNESIQPVPSRFPARAPVWLRPGNHNHLRLTRIMTSLATLGLRDDATALQRCLVKIAAEHGRVTARTLEFWRGALDAS